MTVKFILVGKAYQVFKWLELAAKRESMDKLSVRIKENK
jgi:hypothetical protein